MAVQSTLAFITLLSDKTSFPSSLLNMCMIKTVTIAPVCFQLFLVFSTYTYVDMSHTSITIHDVCNKQILIYTATVATWGDQTCQRFEATAVGFETGFSRLRVRPSNRYAIAPHVDMSHTSITIHDV